MEIVGDSILVGRANGQEARLEEHVIMFRTINAQMELLLRYNDIPIHPDIGCTGLWENRPIDVSETGGQHDDDLGETHSRSLARILHYEASREPRSGVPMRRDRYGRFLREPRFGSIILSNSLSGKNPRMIEK